MEYNKEKYAQQLKARFDALTSQPEKVKELVQEAQHYIDTQDLSDNPYEEVIIGIMEVIQDKRQMSFKQWKVINYFVEQTRKSIGETIPSKTPDVLTW